MITDQFNLSLVSSLRKINSAAFALSFVCATAAFAADLNVAGNLTVTGTVDSDGNTTSFGAKSTSAPTQPGVVLTYADNSVPSGAVDSFQFLINRNPASWLWLHNTPTTGTYSAMRLDSAHQLSLFRADGTTTGLSFTPQTGAIKFGTNANATLTANDTTGLITAAGAFTVSGAFTATGGITNTNGTIAGGGSGLNLDTGGAGDIIFKTNGTERARIKSTGLVGIGTAATNPSVNLTIGNGTALSGGLGVALARGAVTNFFEASDNTKDWIGGVDNTLGYAKEGTLSNHDLAIITNNNPKIYIQATGNVGIGTINPGTRRLNVVTSDPANDVAAEFINARTTGANYGLSASATGSGAGLNQGAFFTASGATSNLGLRIYNVAASSANYALYSDSPAQTFFQGSVGIGTTGPSGKLHVLGTSNYTGTVIADGPSGGYSSWGLYENGAYKASMYWHPGAAGVSFYGPGRWFFESGSVGIGTTNPGQKLTIWGTNGAPATSGSSADGVARFGSSVTNLVLDVGLVGGATPFTWLQSRQQNSYDSNYNLALNPNGGNVGVGTTTPAASLDVGGLAAGGALRTVFARQAEGNTTGAGTFLGVKAWGTQTTPYNNKLFSIESSFYGYLNSSIEFYRGSGAQGGFTTFTTGDGTERVRIDGSGNVGIGTANPTQKLSVAGTIRAYSVVVDTGWSDYVFKPDYKLTSLSEVEEAIKREGHLPGIPSAAEVAEHGVSLGDMQSKLLAKVEELTLHLIRMEKENSELRQRVQSLESSVVRP